MATKLDKSLKRELEVNGELYMLTISPEGMKLVPKGKRKGHELTGARIRSHVVGDLRYHRPLRRAAA